MLKLTAMKTEDFSYRLPPERIAQTPATPRDASRLLVYERNNRVVQHHQFTQIEQFLRPGDILVANNSRVLAARLFGRKPTGGKAEILLLEKSGPQRWKALVGGKRLHEGSTIQVLNKADKVSSFVAEITAVFPGPLREISFNQPIDDALETVGHLPLPPYIQKMLDEEERYQTIYSRPLGSAAAPTAGLHFTSDLLLSLRERGVLFETVTLHVGLDTFKPVEAEAVADHHIHSEWAELSPAAAQRINEAKLAGGRLIAIGTTAVRTLETAALRSAGITGSLQTISQRDASGETADLCPWKPVAAFSGPTDLFIYPGYNFRAVDAMITNFHLPQSSLLMLVGAFMGREAMLDVYKTAVAERYRFYSFGDAMLIL